MRFIALIAITAALASCSKSGQEAKKNEASPAPQADAMSPSAPAGDTTMTAAPGEQDAPAAGEERFYGKKAFTIVYKQTGTETGDFTEHVREWGRKRAEIKKTTTSIAGMSHATATRTVFDGAKMVATDLNTGAVTVMTNPMYNDVVSRMQGKSGVEGGKEMMLAMGGKPTGETGSFAGASCDYWELAQLATRMCITTWGATVMQSAKMGPMTIDKIAVEVREGDGGPDDAFAYDAAKAAQAPDMGELMKGAKGQ